MSRFLTGLNVHTISHPNVSGGPYRGKGITPSISARQGSYLGLKKIADRRKSNKLNLPKQGITKDDENIYCLKSNEYQAVVEELRALRQQHRPRFGESRLMCIKADLRAKILKELPFGPILEAIKIDD